MDAVIGIVKWISYIGVIIRDWPPSFSGDWEAIKATFIFMVIFIIIYKIFDR